ncbi:MAG: methyltransferase [Cyclobacteriaceae bacterium]
MPNSYFQFKHFKIDQGSCAMKVTTEGCLFGALIDPDRSPKHVLDIGTGTGLLALMLAQKYPQTLFDAVEIDAAAFLQARDNFKNSSWDANLNVFHSAIQDHNTAEQYDMIVSNPPFFRGSMTSKSTSGNLARHEEELNQLDLIKSIDRLLTEDGSFWVLYPEREAQTFCQLAIQYSFHLTNQITIFDRVGSKVFRVVQSFSRIEKPKSESNLIIKAEVGYTHDFIELLKDYYLHL